MRYILQIMLLEVLHKISYADNSSCGSQMYSVYNTHDNAFCYESRIEDDLPPLDDSSWMEESIYFIDASCKGGLNVREACSVEAAAKVNPSRQVNVFFAGPVTEACTNSEPLISLLTYSNVQLRRIYVEEYSKDSGLSHLLQSAAIKSGPYPNLYALDLLKFITLHKFDGVYMDLDMMATRPFDDLPSSATWLAIGNPDDELLSAAIFSAGADDVGRKLIESVLSVLAVENPSASWRDSYESFTFLKTAVEWKNGAIPFNKSKNGLSFNHKGLIIYASKVFFPVPCESSKEYFESRLSADALTRAFTQQLCNGLTFNEPVSSNSTYALLMSQFCPKVYDYYARTGFEHNM